MGGVWFSATTWLNDYAWKSRLFWFIMLSASKQFENLTKILNHFFCFLPKIFICYDRLVAILWHFVFDFYLLLWFLTTFRRFVGFWFDVGYVDNSIKWEESDFWSQPLNTLAVYCVFSSSYRERHSIKSWHTDSAAAGPEELFVRADEAKRWGCAEAECRSHCSLTAGAFYDELSPSPSLNNIWAMMIVWRIRGKISRTVLCCGVQRSCAQSYTHWYEQFLQTHCFRIRFCVSCAFTRASLFVLGLVILCFVYFLIV